MCEHGTKITPVFLPADGEASWLLILLTIRQYSPTRKRLSMYPEGANSGLRKPKKDKHQC